MGSFSIWHLAVVLCVIGAFSFLIAVVIRSSRKAAYTFKPIAGLAKWLTAFVGLTMYWTHAKTREPRLPASLTPHTTDIAVAEPAKVDVTR